MTAIDTVLAFATAGAASPFPTALAAAPGDSLTIRSFPAGQRCGLNAIIYSAGGGQKFRLLSANIHDNVTGLTFEPAEVPSQFLIPRDADIPMVSGDTVVLQGGIAAAGTIVAALQLYYTQMSNIGARLHSWGDISGNYKYVKPVEVDLGAIAVGAWTDTLITATENQLHAGKDYAVLGYTPSASVDVLGVKGAFTGNLRVCGPGTTETLDVTEYFIRMSELNGTPYIPVFNADDRFAISVSAAHHAAVGAGATHAYLILAELLTPLSDR
jgi:hypothetical protein